MLTKKILKASSNLRAKQMISLSQMGFHKSSHLNEIMTVRDAIRQAMTDEMHRDPNVFLMGEEVA